MVYRKKTSRKNYAKKTKVFGKISTSNLVARKRRSNLIKLIKDTQISESEMKYKSGTISVLSLNHNNIYEFHCWAGAGSTVNMNCLPGQGTNDGARIGDRIYLKGILVRGLFQITGDRRNTSLAFYWVEHNSEQGSPGSYNDFFHNVTGSSMMDTLQKKKFPGVKFLGRLKADANDQWIAGAYNGAESSKSIYFKRFIPIDKKVYFKADASNTPTNLKEYGTIVVAPYQNVNTLATDTLVVNCDMHSTAYFKDI